MSSFPLKCPRAEIIEGVLAEVFLSSVTLDHCRFEAALSLRALHVWKNTPPPQL